MSSPSALIPGDLLLLSSPSCDSPLLSPISVHSLAQKKQNSSGQAL